MCQVRLHKIGPLSHLPMHQSHGLSARPSSPLSHPWSFSMYLSWRFTISLYFPSNNRLDHCPSSWSLAMSNMKLKKSSTPSFYVEKYIIRYAGKDTWYLNVLGNLITIWWMQPRQFVISIFVIHTSLRHPKVGAKWGGIMSQTLQRSCQDSNSWHKLASWA